MKQQLGDLDPPNSTVKKDAISDQKKQDSDNEKPVAVPDDLNNGSNLNQINGGFRSDNRPNL